MYKDLDILMVSYSRTRVLYHTLNSIVTHITEPELFNNINLFLSINKSSKNDYNVVEDFQQKLPEQIDRFVPTHYADNYGKAYCLNRMFDEHCKTSSHVLILDQDMVFNEPFMPHVEKSAEYECDIMGYASSEMWIHQPLKEKALGKNMGDHKIYYASYIGGAMMLIPNKFLYTQKWTNLDGVYGGDDFTMCDQTDRKLIYFSDTDWVRHDPYGEQMPELKKYYKLKEGKFLLPKGWYDA